MGRNRKYTLNEDYFSSIDSKNKAYVLGFVYADGSVYNNYLSFRLANKDIEILKFISSELGYGGKIRRYRSKKRNYVDLTVYSKRISSDLNRYGIVQNKTQKSKHLPLVSEKYLNEMIRGFFDGDGSIYSFKKSYTINFSSNKSVLNQLKTMLAIRGISSGKIKNRYHGNDISCMVDIRGNNNIEKIYWFLYSKDSFCLKRKKKKFDEFLINRDRRVFIDKEKIKKLYLSGMRQIDISKKERLLYSSVKSIIQRLKIN